MLLNWQTFTIHKRVPLTISRGTTSENTNIWLQISEENIEGWGEASPFDITSEEKKPDKILQELNSIAPILQSFHPCQRQEIEKILWQNQISSATRAAIDTALHDWLGKKANLPLWQIFGLDRSLIPPVSVTIGLNSPENVGKRVLDWLEIGDFSLLKVKLGSPDGIEADRAIILAIKEIVPHLPLTVDANGGWRFSDAVKMCQWLKEKGVIYVEQPLSVGQERDLIDLYQKSPLPIFVDESCFSSQDIPKLADRVHGINIKLMKAGGLAEVQRMIHVAQACRLQIMFGCYSDSSLANTALAHLGPLVNYLDLDSHLNLRDDPFTGLSLEKGRLQPNNSPGLGVSLRTEDD
ncbi:dipeptide epimerase [Microcystis aeruginosa FACHB-524]|uniref:dipeptide epimerase n=1 Tax=Microcystis aeruginosa TaxID=1126 RepID=UPI000F4599BD|nr:dipeptide epimerase [Microcystis aeruginosa]ROI04190.1 dipeptide epimerase [Microcystis aeruginosa FACHB-524]